MPHLTIKEALEQVDDDLSDGAWMQMMEDLTGLDAGELSAQLAAAQRRREKKALKQWRANRKARRAARREGASA